MLGFSRKKNEETSENKEVRNWYEDRYQTILVHRNLLLFALLIALLGIFFAVIAVMKISTSKTLEPFIIEVEDKTGITNVVRPFDRERFSTDDTLKRYFIMKYLTARETYSAFDYEYNYYTVVRLMSDSSINYAFRRSIGQENPNSPISFGDKLQRTIRLKSLTFLPSPPPDPKRPNAPRLFTAQARFVMEETGARRGTYHRIATLTFGFFDMTMTRDERFINPLGFQVRGYRVDDEAAQ